MTGRGADVDVDDAWMRVAFGLGRRGLGRVWPNPAVGCVLVRDGRVVGRGWTQPGGRPHAETMALAQAGRRAHGATAYVTLEPCAHFGQSPPCAAALIGAGVARVVVPIVDPDPRVNGGGLAALRAAGIAVSLGRLAAEATVANQGFLSRIRRGRPMLTLKLATSIDGRIATATGESRWITGPEARRDVHRLRAEADGVLVGGGTARADDPRLDVRGIGVEAAPVRIVASADLSLPLDGHLGRTAGRLPLWLCHASDAPADRAAAWRGLGAITIETPRGTDGALDMAALGAALGARGLTRVLCEGGGRLAGSLLRAGLVDEIVCYTAGMALGREGVPSVGPMGQGELALAPRFALAATRRIGSDVRTTWRNV